MNDTKIRKDTKGSYIADIVSLPDIMPGFRYEATVLGLTNEESYGLLLRCSDIERETFANKKTKITLTFIETEDAFVYKILSQWKNKKGRNLLLRFYANPRIVKTSALENAAIDEVFTDLKMTSYRARAAGNESKHFSWVVSFTAKKI